MAITIHPLVSMLSQIKCLHVYLLCVYAYVYGPSGHVVDCNTVMDFNAYTGELHGLLAGCKSNMC